MQVYDHEYIRTNGVTLHVVQAGPVDGPLVILLHGFPEYWYGWHHQMDALASHGFRVWVPDQRGYNLSDKPEGVAAYTRDQLATDVIGLIDAAGRERAFIGGHDWGAAVAWWLAQKYPARVEKLVIANVPHHDVMRQALREDFRQRLKSWYIAFFQIPRVPEWLLSANDYQGLTRLLRGSARPDTFTDAELTAYRGAWSQPGALTGMLNWYRAIAQIRLEKPASPRIKPPTLILWGVHDVALTQDMAEPSRALCDDGQLTFFEDATHWVLHDEPVRTSAQIVHFFTTTAAS